MKIFVYTFFSYTAATTKLANAFSSPVFQETASRRATAPSQQEGVDIELPDFDELFGRIQQVSPLARSVIAGKQGGFEAVDETWPSNLKWNIIEKSNKPRRGSGSLHQIDKIDNFNGASAPMLRFRASLQGPCIGECFANFIMEYKERRKWDAQIEQVYEIYPIYDLDAANIAMGFGSRYGDCSRLGIGYCQTKSAAGNLITPREQLTLCGIQDFHDTGSCIMWGVEMEDWHNHLLPPGPRFTRAKSHLFATTLTPTGPDSFDVEYILQLDIGGKIPSWMTAPIVVDSVKSLFRTAEQYFIGKCGGLKEYLEEKESKDAFANKYSLLMTP